MAQPSNVSQVDRVKSVDAALNLVIASLEKEQELKKSIRESLEPIEDVVRSGSAELNRLHSSTASEHPGICNRALETIQKVKPLWSTTSSLVPSGEFYRYQFALGPTMRNLTSLIVMIMFMLNDELASASTVAETMGVGHEGSQGLFLTSEDYLQGVISAVNELGIISQPRLSINSVTAQNFDLPVKIASFVNDIFASYSLLNLRNDNLRRKFDSLKYDLKRCEDVVYDLTLRGLIKAPAKSS